LSTSGAGGKDWLHGYNGTTLKRGRRKWQQECNPNVILALSVSGYRIDMAFALKISLQIDEMTLK
jgi:hypothetical protein